MNSTKPISFLAISLGIINLTPVLAIAEDLSNQNAETIVVSATKSAKSINSVGASIRLITKKEIEASQAVQLIDALANNTGISFARNGGNGQTASIFIRGGESHDTLLVYDGVVQSEPSLPAGNFDFANFILGDVARIEVLKGPQSVLYGSDAIGGVISVVSVDPIKPLEGALNLETGSLETFLARASIGGNKSALKYSLAVQNFETGGISAKAKSIGGKEKDGFQSQGAASRISYEFNDGLSLILRANYLQGKVDFDGFPAPFYNFEDTKEYSETSHANMYLGLNHTSSSGKLRSVFSIKSSQSDRRNFDPALTPNSTYIATSQNETYEYFGDLELSKGIDFVFGFLSNDQKYSSRSPAPWDPNPIASRAAADIESIYGEFQYENQKGIFATFGVRHDSHSSFGDHTTIRTSLAFSPQASKTHFHINYGEGFKAPSLFQIYSDYGNLDIKPEIANVIEMGVTQELLENWHISLVGFNRSSENQIDYFSCFGATASLCATRPFGFYDNIKKTKAKGLEIETNYKNGEVSFDAGLAIIEAKNNTIGAVNFGKRLARRPELSGNLAVNYQITPKFNASINYNFVGERYDDGANNVRLIAYNLFGVRASLKWNEEFEIYGRIENLLDEEYTIVSNYGTLPQTLNFGIRAKF